MRAVEEFIDRRADTEALGILATNHRTDAGAQFVGAQRPGALQRLVKRGPVVDRIGQLRQTVGHQTRHLIDLPGYLLGGVTDHRRVQVTRHPPGQPRGAVERGPGADWLQRFAE